MTALLLSVFRCEVVLQKREKEETKHKDNEFTNARYVKAQSIIEGLVGRQEVKRSEQLTINGIRGEEHSTREEVLQMYGIWESFSVFNNVCTRTEYFGDVHTYYFFVKRQL